MPAVVDRRVPRLRRPDQNMRRSGTDFVIAAGASVGLGGARTGDRSHCVFIAVGSGFDSPVAR